MANQGLTGSSSTCSINSSEGQKHLLLLHGVLPEGSLPTLGDVPTSGLEQDGDLNEQCRGDTG